MKNQNVLRSTLLLTLSGIGAKGIDFIFRAYYSKQLGSEGLGLFSLCFAVHGIMLNVATAGLGVAVSKLISEKLSQRRYDEIKKTMSLAVGTVSILSVCVILAVSLFSKEIATIFLKEPRCSGGLVCIAPSILFMGISYCIKGYFYASRRVFPPASSEFLEQAVKIFSITILLSRWLPKGIEYGCEAVFLGLSIGELSSCLYLSIYYIRDSKKFNKKATAATTVELGAGLAQIGLPVTINSLSSSFLRMQEQVLIISSLKRSGLEHSMALKLYGGVYGMVMPLIVFPLTLLSSCFTMLVPEISRAYTMNNQARLKTLISRIYRFCGLFGFFVMCVLVTFADQLQLLVYNTEDISRTLKLLALFTPIMFMDSVSCGMLNGMGKQISILKHSLADSLGRILLIVMLVPRFGNNALLFIIILSNIFTCFLSTGDVHKMAKIHFSLSERILKHSLSAVVTWFVADSLIVKHLSGAVPGVIWGILILAIIYFSISFLLNSRWREDFDWIKDRMLFDT